MENTSGQGSQAVVPKEVKGWNWGAFLLTWIWGIGNNVRLALIVLISLAGFIMVIMLGGEPAMLGGRRAWAIIDGVWQVLFLLMPFVGCIMAIVLGIKGSQWAWQNKSWDSIKHFRKTQRRWAWWGTGLFFVGLGLFVAASPIFNRNPSPYEGRGAARIERDNVQIAVTTMTEYNDLETLPNPVVIATNDMSAFPDATSVAGSSDKLKDAKGNIYGSGDKNGYLLYGHDSTADNSTTGLVNYIAAGHYTKGTYTVDAAGTVTQVTTGFE